MKNFIYLLIVLSCSMQLNANIIRELLAVTHPIYTHDKVMERDARKRVVEEQIFHREFDMSPIHTAWEKSIENNRFEHNSFSSFLSTGYLSPIFLSVPKE